MEDVKEEKRIKILAAFPPYLLDTMCRRSQGCDWPGQMTGGNITQHPHSVGRRWLVLRSVGCGKGGNIDLHHIEEI